MDINVIQAHTPTTDADEAETDQFHESTETVLSQCNRHEISIVMGDLKAKVGQGRVEQVVGTFDLSEGSDRGDKLVEWCLEKAQIVVNT